MASMHIIIGKLQTFSRCSRSFVMHHLPLNLLETVWNQELDTKTRRLLTLGKMHHPKADVDGFYILVEGEADGALPNWSCLTRLPLSA